MTKQFADKIKNVIKSHCKSSSCFTYYYKSSDNEFRVMIDRVVSGSFDEERLIEVLNALTENGLRPKFRTEEKIYQGFIKCFYIVFY